MQERLMRVPRDRGQYGRRGNARACNSSGACILSFARTRSLAAFCSCKHRKRTLLLALRFAQDNLLAALPVYPAPGMLPGTILPVYNLRKSTARRLKPTIIFVPSFSRRGGEGGEERYPGISEIRACYAPRRTAPTFSRET